MQAVILAAGKGTRMGIKDAPKCLLKIGNKSIIEHQVNYLRNIGCKKILVVTGYNSNKIKNTLGNSAEYIFNKNFENSNNMYSLWLCRDTISFSKHTFISNADVVFDKTIVKRIVDNLGDYIVCDKGLYNDESMKITLNSNCFVNDSGLWGTNN